MKEGQPSDLPPNGSLPGTSRAGAAQPGAVQAAVPKTAPSAIGTSRIDACQAGATQPGAVRDGAFQAGPSATGVAQAGRSVAGAPQTAPSATGTSTAVSQHDPSEAGAPSPLSAEPLTDELLEHLLASATPDAFLAEAQLVDRSLSEYLHLLLQDKGLTRGAVIRAAGLNATFAYQCFQGTRKPGRDHAIMLAFGLCCTLTETQRLLRYAGHAELWCKLRRDAIIIYSVEHGHTRAQCDDELYRLGEDTLLPAG